MSSQLTDKEREFFDKVSSIARRMDEAIQKFDTANEMSREEIIESSILLGFRIAKAYDIDIDSLPMPDDPNVVPIHKGLNNSYDVGEVDIRRTWAKAREAVGDGEDQIIAELVRWAYGEAPTPEDQLVAISMFLDAAREEGVNRL